MDDIIAHTVRFIKKLNKDERQQVKALEKKCNEERGIYYKLDPGSLEEDNDKINHILWETGGNVCGYMSLSCYGDEEIEVTPIIQGNKTVFMDMVEMVVKKVKEQNYGKILFILDKNDIFLVETVKALGLTYLFAEHRMNFDETKFKAGKKSDLIIQDATSEYRKDLADFDKINFRCSEEKPNMEGVKIALLGGKIAGKIKLNKSDGVVGLYGFVVGPGFRGKGLGREILNAAITDVIQTGYHTMYLEVESENAIALHLYKSMGFVVKTTFEYYENIL